MSSIKEETRKLQRLLEQTAGKLSDEEREALRKIPAAQDDEIMTVEIRDQAGVLYVTMQPTVGQWKRLIKVKQHV
jgi:hypothetical protein